MANIHSKPETWFEVASDALYFNGRMLCRGEYISSIEMDTRLQGLLSTGMLIVKVAQQEAA